MNTAIINIKVEPTVKKQAQRMAQQLGLSLSGIINGYLRHLIRTKEVYFSLSEEPTEYLIQALREAEKETKEGLVSPAFDNANDAIAWLKNPKAKYANQIR